MKVKAYAILIALIFLIQIPTLAQVTTRAELEDCFQWFPAGQYESILFLNSQIMNSDKLNMLKGSSYQTSWTQDFLFRYPLFLEKNCTRLIFAFCHPADVLSTEENNSQETVLFTIFLPDDKTVNQIEKNALARNLIIDTGETVADFPIYKAITKEDSGSLNGYLLFSPTQQIVFAPMKEGLCLIAETGFGMKPGILDGEEAEILLDETDLLGPVWETHDVSPTMKREIKEQELGEASEEELNKLESELSAQPLLCVSTLILDDDKYIDR